LTPVGHQSTGGKTPRNFGIDPTGSFVLAANQSSDSVVVFRVDQQSGKLTQAASIEVPTPVCVKFLPIEQ
jgi:6-phosphogluconolactonase